MDLGLRSFGGELKRQVKELLVAVHDPMRDVHGRPGCHHHHAFRRSGKSGHVDTFSDPCRLQDLQAGFRADQLPTNLPRKTGKMASECG